MTYKATNLQLLKTMKFRLTTDELVTKYGITITFSHDETKASVYGLGTVPNGTATRRSACDAVTALCGNLGLPTEASTDDLIKRYKLDVVSGCGYAKATSPSGITCTSTSRDDAVNTVAATIERNKAAFADGGYVANGPFKLDQTPAEAIRSAKRSAEARIAAYVEQEMERVTKETGALVMAVYVTTSSVYGDSRKLIGTKVKDVEITASIEP